MKADSGNWLYIILSIVFLVISFFGNKDKKKTTTSTQPINDDYEPTPSTPERHWPKSLGDVLSEVLDVPKQQQVVTEKPNPWNREVVLESPQNSYEKIEDEAKSLETIEEETFTYESPVELKKNRVQTIDTPMSAEIKEEREPAFAFSNFDLREGIIYAEILNRKYF
jgi:hypothetical protein